MNYIAIDQFDTANGTGIGTVLWVSGCDHNCPQCHNPQTHDPNYGQNWTERQMKFLLETLKPYYITRLTISGGDPLYPSNRSEVENIVKTVKTKFPQKCIWLYTGYIFENIRELELLNYVDVLVDGPFLIQQKDINLKFRGSSNQRIIQLKGGN